mgnify:FL=1
MNINIQFDAKQLINATKKEPMIALQEIQKAVNKSALKITLIAQRQEAPKKGGQLAQKIKPRFEPLKGIVEALASYSLYVHEGTRPHIIRPKSLGYRGHKGGLGNRKTGFGVYNLVHHPGTKPNRFMTRSVEKAMPNIINYFKQALDNILRRI